MKATLTISKDGKMTLEKLPKDILPGSHQVNCDILFSVGSHEPKKVSLLNKTLFDEAKILLEENTKSNHIGWYGLGELIDHLEENYTITKKEL